MNSNDSPTERASAACRHRPFVVISCVNVVDNAPPTTHPEENSFRDNRLATFGAAERCQVYTI
jgi:hypothetical protein